MKRAAVQWGIGRVFYSMDVVWVDIEKQGKSWIIPKGQRAVLDKTYLDTLSKLNLTPAPAGGVQSALSPKQTKETPTPVQPMPQTKPDEKDGIYTVLAARLENRSNSTAHVLLERLGGEKLHAFAIGAHSAYLRTQNRHHGQKPVGDVSAYDSSRNRDGTAFRWHPDCTEG